MDVHDLKQMLEEGFEQLLEEMVVAWQKKMQAEAAKAEERATIAGMDWRYSPARMLAGLCELARKVCGKLDVFCWILGGRSKEAEDDHMDDPMGKVRGA